MVVVDDGVCHPPVRLYKRGDSVRWQDLRGDVVCYCGAKVVVQFQSPEKRARALEEADVQRDHQGEEGWL